MTDQIAELEAVHGRLVRTVTAYVTFFGLERWGQLVEVSINLEGARSFVFGCGGDGGVSVLPLQSPVNDPPHMATVARVIPDIGGQLHESKAERNALRVVIGDAILTLVNIDDQLELTVNGQPLPSDFLQRES